jgi:DNA-binding NarL/FixJ family response regulator
VVVDDQHLTRRGLVTWLGAQPDLLVVAEATSERGAVRASRRLRPDVIVLQVRVPARGALSIVEAVLAASPDTRILAISERGEARCLALNPPRPGETWDPRRATGCQPVTDCLELAVWRGVHGTIRSDAQPEHLLRAIRSLAAGRTSYDVGTATRLRARAREQGAGTGRLTSRELEVARLLADGRSNKEIARRLGVGEPTVKKHMSRILLKLGLQDRLQVGLYLARNPQALAMAPAGAAAQWMRRTRRARTTPPTSTRAQ